MSFTVICYYATFWTGLRQKECEILQKAGMAQTLSTSMGPTLPVLAGVIMFVAHVTSGNNLSPTQVCIKLF